MKGAVRLGEGICKSLVVQAPRCTSPFNCALNPVYVKAFSSTTAADQGRVMQEQMSGGPMPTDPSKAFEVNIQHAFIRVLLYKRI